MEMTVLTWVLTYAVHSTVLIGSVWLITSLIPRISLPTKESLWKAALLGALSTATLQTALGIGSPWGNLELPSALDTSPVLLQEVPGEPDAEANVETRIVRHRSGELTITTTREQRPTATPAVATVQRAGEPSPWPWVILCVAGLGGLFALFRLWFAARRLKAQLRGRRDVVEDPLLETFLTLCQKAGFKKRVRLTASSHLRSPVALWNREIVIPDRAIEGLTAKQQESMLAHEIAHLLRRDPYWLVVAAVVEAIFFFQPLNHLARRKIQECAEFQCDDWAARHTGTGVHLAKCLAEVAGWMEGGHAPPPTVVAMADEESPIVRRITRLLNERRPTTGTGPSVVRVAGVLGVLGLVGWLAPGVTRGIDREELKEADKQRPHLASASVVRGDGDVRFADVRGEDGVKRSHVTIESDDETVHVEVARPEEREPDPVPEPESRGGGLRIQIHGHSFLGDEFDAFFGIDIDGMDDIEDELEEAFEELADELDDLDGIHFHHGCGRDRCGRHEIERRIERERERVERDLERAQRHAERAQRHAERDRRHAERDREKAERRAEKARERIEHAQDVFDL